MSAAKAWAPFDRADHMLTDQATFLEGRLGRDRARVLALGRAQTGIGALG